MTTVDYIQLGCLLLCVLVALFCGFLLGRAYERDMAKNIPGG